MVWPFTSKYPQRRPEEIDNCAYDYVICGGGTAGCVLASRLSEDPKTSVLLLETGPANDTWASRVPLMSGNIHDPSTGAVNWLCEPMQNCENRQTPVFRGEALGGTSRINALLYTRGAPANYDAWSSLGHIEWGYKDVLPYFVKSEKTLSNAKAAYHGTSGPWVNQAVPYLSWPYKAYHAFQQSAEAMGFDHITDMSSPEAPSDGLATLDAIVNQENKRMSTFDAFLPNEIALEREKNLTICTGVTVSRIAFSDGETKQRAEQVHFHLTKQSKSDKLFSAKVKKEVIICSGALGSPQILMLSGIGPRQHLEEHGIEVVHDLPGVGSELSDHMALPIAWEVPAKESLTYVVTSPLKIGKEFFRYLLFGTGLLGRPVQGLMLLVRGSSLKDATSELFSQGRPVPNSKDTMGGVLRVNALIPDIEIIPLNLNAIDDTSPISKSGVFSMLATLLRPKSRGSVRLRSSNPYDKPRVDLGFLSNPEDYVMARKSIRLALRISDGMKATGFPLLRGLSAPALEADDEEIDKVVRHYARTTYHYSGTCRMASESDKKAPGVVDDSLRVHGIQNLRVCDASIFPQIIAAHLMAPVVMVAEKCADMIKASLESGA